MAKDFDKLVSKNSIIKQVASRTSMNENTRIDIPLDKIRVNPANRSIFDIKDADVKKVAESIERRGFRGAIEVYALPGGEYEIYSGHIRYEAQKFRGAKTIPAFVKPYPDSEETILDDLISSNVDGRVLSPMERARAVDVWESKLLKCFDGNINKELARRFGCGVSTIKRLKNLLRLIPELQEKVDSEAVMYSALAAASSLTPKEQMKLDKKINKFIEKNSVDDLNKAIIESMIKEIQNKAPAEPVKRKAVAAKLPKACMSFRKVLEKDETYTDEEKTLLAEELRQIREEIDKKISMLGG